MADVSINPKSLVVAGAIVNASNPLPVTFVVGAAIATNVRISPSSIVVDGSIVNASNPVPVSVT